MFAPGELVVCVDVSNHNGGGIPHCGGFLRIGGVYRVVECAASAQGPLGVMLRGDPMFGLGVWAASRFRKLDALADLDTRAAHETYRLKPALNPARHSVEQS